MSSCVPIRKEIQCLFGGDIVNVCECVCERERERERGGGEDKVLVIVANEEFVRNPTCLDNSD